MLQQQQQCPFVYIFIPYRLPESSILSKSFALCERRPKIPSPECSTPMGSVYIVIHRQTVSFYQNSSVLSELFGVARHVGRSKPGSKPSQLYVRLSLRPLGLFQIIMTNISISLDSNLTQQQKDFLNLGPNCHLFQGYTSINKNTETEILCQNILKLQDNQTWIPWSL